MIVVHFYFDLLSPYSYLAWQLLKRKIHGDWSKLCRLQLHPVHLPTIMRQSGNIPPGRCPNKALWLRADLPRFCRLHGIQFRMPAGGLPDSSHAMALLHHHRDSDDLAKMVDQLWTEGYVGQGRTWSVEGLKELGYAEAFDIAPLKELTMSLVEELHLFGAPTIILEWRDGRKELFFGSDRFDQMDAMIHSKI